jgi:hypothetical protein
VNAGAAVALVLISMHWSLAMDAGALEWTRTEVDAILCRYLSRKIESGF